MKRYRVYYRVESSHRPAATVSMCVSARDVFDACYMVRNLLPKIPTIIAVVDLDAKHRPIKPIC